MSERKFKVGDRVVITANASSFKGNAGTIRSVADDPYATIFPYNVVIDDYRFYGGTPFNEDELTLEGEKVTQ